MVRLTALILLALVALGIASCGPASDGSGAAGEADGTFDQPLVLWREGRREEAVEALCRINWSERNDFLHPLLTMSEREFAHLPAGEQEQLHAEELLPLTGELRAMARAAQEEYGRRREAGNEEGAVEIMDAIGGFGDALARPGRLEIIRTVGEAIQNIARQH